MKQTILENIIKKKKDWLDYYKKKNPISSFKDNIILSNRNFYKNLKNKFPAFILEYKKKSPSLGILRKNFNLLEISNVYKKYASVISIVTDSYFFDGSFKDLNKMSQLVKQPILCKDFIIDEYQIFLARYYKADAILLMLSVLNDEQYIYLSNIAKKLNMGILTEIYNINEMYRAEKLKAKVIGINNRNLHNLSININNTKILAPLISKKAIIISESGIDSFKKIKDLRKIVQGFLIGSYLMRKKDINFSVKKLIFGNNKICGLTNEIDAKNSEKIGAIYGGLIFCKDSIRKININIAKNIIKSAKLKYVGVFQNQNIYEIINICKKINFYAIQLHGNEDQNFINTLIKHINYKINIWKVFNITNFIPKINLFSVNKYLFDNITGGSGKTFNWSLLKNKNIKNIFISGGLNEYNCKKALKLNCFGLDFNSGVEIKPGIKDIKKMKTIFNILRTY